MGIFKKDKRDHNSVSSLNNGPPVPANGGPSSGWQQVAATSTGPGHYSNSPIMTAEAMPVSDPSSPMPGMNSSLARLNLASSRNLPSGGPSSRAASPAGRTNREGNAFVSSPVSVSSPSARHPLSQSAGPVPPPKPFHGPAASHRANSDSAILPNGSARQRPPYAGGAGVNGYANGGPPMVDPGKKMVAKNRPSSFLGFLSNNSSRSSVVTATLNGAKKSGSGPKAGKGAKPVITEAVSISSGPSRKGPSRVVAVVGNVRMGMGRLIIEELVREKTIVVALTDAHDGQFGKDLEALALSPSLFHAFPVPTLFGNAFVPQQAAAGDYTAGSSASTPNLSMSTGSTPSLNPLGIPTPPPLGSTASFPSMGKRGGRFSKASSPRESADQIPGLTTSGKLSAATKAFNDRHACLIELSNIFKSYRVDTVIAIFEPRDRNVTNKSSGGGSRTPKGDPKAADASSSVVPPLPPAQEKARIEEMERVCLQAAIECGAGRFATCAWTPSLFPTPLSAGPTPPPDYIRRAPLSATVFRWGLIMNELATGVPPNEHGETALGRWLEPPSRRSGRFVVDYGRSTCYLPDVQGKGKGVGGVSLTLAEDVARFIGLACKMKAEWDWSMGTMVGERIRGGWEEIVDMLDTVCRYNFRREYVSAPLDDSSPSSSMDHLNAPSDPHMRRNNSGDSTSTSSGEDSAEAQAAAARRRERSPADLDDVLRGHLAKENLDASSVRLGEFLRVWFAPRPRSGALGPPVHGPRAVRPSASFENQRPRHDGPHRGPPPSRSAGAAQHGQPRGPPAGWNGHGPPPNRTDVGRGPNGMVNGNGHYPGPGGGGGGGGGGNGGHGQMLTMSGGRHHPASMAPAVRSPLAQSA